jgi:chemotaxis protein MotB
MAKLNIDDSGEMLIAGKGGGKPPPLKPAGKQRKFPFRLWAWAIVATAGMGAGGYYAWGYRDQAHDATRDLATKSSALDQAQAGLKTCNASLDDADKKLGDLTSKSKDTESQLSATSSAKDQCDAALKVAQKAKEDSDKRVASVAEFQKKFSDMVGTGKLKVAGHHGNLVLELPSEVLFPSGSADLSKTGEYNVVEVAAILKAMPDRRFLVVGHTDSAPLKGSIYKDNWELSTARALTVAHVMVTAGMKPQNLIPAGEGEFDPIASDAGADGRQRNRRIEIILMPAITELPPLPAGIEDASAAGAKKTK